MLFSLRSIFFSVFSYFFFSFSVECSQYPYHPKLSISGRSIRLLEESKQTDPTKYFTRRRTTTKNITGSIPIIKRKLPLDWHHTGQSFLHQTVNYDGNHPLEQRHRHRARLAEYNAFGDKEDKIRKIGTWDGDDDDFHHSFVNYEEQHYDDTVSSDHYQPIRIRFVTTPLERRRGESLAIDEQIDELINTALPTAARQWSKHLSVIPVSGKLHIPNDICYGAFQNDLINEYLQQPRNNQHTQGLFVSNADMVIIVSAMNELPNGNNGQVIPVCGPKKLALGSACALDQYDRPLIGFVNICLYDDNNNNNKNNDDNSQTSSTTSISDLDDLITIAFQAGNQLDTTTSSNDNQPNNSNKNINTPPRRSVDLTTILSHELAHTLGFDFYMFKFFRNATTFEPLTPRPFQETQVQCMDGSQRTMNGFPSSQILRRSAPNHWEIVLPRVTQVARNHFNCQKELHGVPLETYDSGACIGSHWDERLFLEDLMSPTLSARGNILSPLTLALFAESGFYKVNFLNVSTPTFGLGADCKFLSEPCIVINAFSDGSQNQPGPQCLHTECDIIQQKVVVGQGDFRQVCDYDGQILPNPFSDHSYIECPRLAAICSHLFCPGACSGRGLCDYKALPHPKCLCFDSNNTSDGCYDPSFNNDGNKEKEKKHNRDRPLNPELLLAQEKNTSSAFKNTFLLAIQIPIFSLFCSFFYLS